MPFSDAVHKTAFINYPGFYIKLLKILFWRRFDVGISENAKIRIGIMKKGKRNLITDVKGVTVGHCTLRDGAIQTGVTAILPHQGNIFQEKLMASSHVINGFGKSIGLVQIEELGTLETPIVLTNTLSVGAAAEALVKYMMEKNKDIGDTTGTINPVVCECNDSWLNDIRGLHVKEKHVRKALENCAVDFEEGAVGGGRGMRCHQVKGGIGSSSRIFSLDGKEYTIGALCMTNHALFRDLVISGELAAEHVDFERYREKDRGSVITILATDAPLSERQLKRLCKRVIVGLSRTGSYMGNGSGEIAIAFSTANQIPHYPKGDIIDIQIIHDNIIDELFRGVAEAVEEAVLSSMLHAETVTGKNQVCVQSLRELLNLNG